jgi:hypothetical protein
MCVLLCDKQHLLTDVEPFFKDGDLNMPNVGQKAGNYWWGSSPPLLAIVNIADLVNVRVAHNIQWALGMNPLPEFNDEKVSLRVELKHCWCVQY